MQTALERILIAMGFCALAFVALLRVDSAVGERSAREDLADRFAAGSPEAGPPDTSEWSEARRAAWQASRNVSAGAPLGVLSIASIGLSVALLDGTDEITLNRGVGRVAGTRIETNLGISGHRDGFFRGLRHVAPGDRIRLEIPGAAYEYEVRTLSVVSPDDVRVLEPTPEPTLTLVTCFPFFVLGPAPQRFIVHAVRVVDPQADPDARGLRSDGRSKPSFHPREVAGR